VYSDENASSDLIGETVMQSTNTAVAPPYPIRVEGHLERPSRWSWMVKWLLALPHAVVLAGLWIAFLVSSVAAFVAVAVTGRYPRSLFDFNVGVMRWSWRVVFYAYGANGTDRYPPFTLVDVPDYPARLQVAYPEHERRGLTLIGWWLAGVPQYLIAGMFVGGGVLGLWGGASSFGLIGLLVLVGAVLLLVRGTYPRSIFDLVLGLNRWVLRVVAYAALMSTEYPPFRIDAGEDDLAAAIAMPSVGATTEVTGHSPVTWGPRRIAASVLTSLTALLGIAAIVAGGTALALDQTQRNPSGYLTTAAAPYSTGTYALESDSYHAGTAAESSLARGLLGTIRIHSVSNHPVFIGIAPANPANQYLAHVAHAEAADLGAHSSDFQPHSGSAPAALPAAEHFWAAYASGAGEQTLTWKVRSGNWRVIVMNANATRDVTSDLSIGASFPHLQIIGIAALAAGLLILLLSGSALYLVVRRRR
jgi:hypothetical protein